MAIAVGAIDAGGGGAVDNGCSGSSSTGNNGDVDNM